MDENLALKVRDGTFLKTLNYENLTKEQKPAAIQVAERLGDHFTESVMKKSRRISISIKRKKPADFKSSVSNSQKTRRDSEVYDSALED